MVTKLFLGRKVCWGDTSYEWRHTITVFNSACNRQYARVVGNVHSWTTDKGLFQANQGYIACCVVHCLLPKNCVTRAMFAVGVVWFPSVYFLCIMHDQLDVVHVKFFPDLMKRNVISWIPLALWKLKEYSTHTHIFWLIFGVQALSRVQTLEVFVAWKEILPSLSLKFVYHVISPSKFSFNRFFWPPALLLTAACHSFLTSHFYILSFIVLLLSINSKTACSGRLLFVYLWRHQIVLISLREIYTGTFHSCTLRASVSHPCWDNGRLTLHVANFGSGWQLEQNNYMNFISVSRRFANERITNATSTTTTSTTTTTTLSATPRRPWSLNLKWFVPDFKESLPVISVMNSRIYSESWQEVSQITWSHPVTPWHHDKAPITVKCNITKLPNGLVTFPCLNGIWTNALTDQANGF